MATDAQRAALMDFLAADRALANYEPDPGQSPEGRLVHWRYIEHTWRAAKRALLEAIEAEGGPLTIGPFTVRPSFDLERGCPEIARRGPALAVPA